MPTTTDALAWLRSHEEAFNTGRWDAVLDDYTDDAVLEVHLDGQVLEFAGRDAIRGALELGSAAGVQTRVRRVVATAECIAAQIDGPDGNAFMVSFWELRDGRIARDVSILTTPTGGFTHTR